MSLLLKFSALPPLRSALSSSNLNNEDKLARESDVTVSTNVTLHAEYKGFIVYVLSTFILVSWIGWALLPERVLNNYFSIYYYPDKYWLMAIPSYFLLGMLFYYISLAMYNTEVLTLPLNDIRTIVDEHSVFPGSGGTSEEQIAASIDYLHKAPSGVWDLPITLVNEVLYANE